MHNVDSTSKDYSKKQYITVEKVQDMKSKNIASGSRYSLVVSSSKMIPSDCSGEINTVRAVEIATAVTPTADDHNATNKDIVIESFAEMYVFCE